MNINLSQKDKIKILNSDDVFEIMQKILLREDQIDRDKEHFWIIGLNLSNRILFIELVSMGSVKASIVEPINVFRVAVLKNAVKVILVHNHPSGETTPSKDDKDLTDRLIQVGKILAIEVIDHLVITLKSFLSFTDIGLFDELKESTKWVPAFELIERIKKEQAMLRKEAVKTAEKKGEKNKAVEIAREMKKDGKTIEDIIKYTSLSKREIEKI